ncbi:hypothetical protein N2152v2_005716 [Parachlorella kessleri]
MSSPEKPENGTSEEAKPASPTPIFGSASTFGAGSGFAGFTGVKPEAIAAAAAGDEEGGDEAAEEECKAEFQPLVQLEEVEVKSGEEEETLLFDSKSKLYRFDNESSEWKERGVGQAKLLQHKENKRTRFLFRQEKTLKIRANHIVMPGSKVQEHGGSDKAMVWSCVDFADEEQRMEMFCIRFANAERAQQFKESYEGAAAKNEPLLKEVTTAEGRSPLRAYGTQRVPAPPPAESATDKAADELAGEVEKKATVEDNAAAEEKPE